MTYQHYSPEFKAKIVLQVLQGEKELGEVAKEHNMSRWTMLLRPPSTLPALLCAPDAF